MPPVLRLKVAQLPAVSAGAATAADQVPAPLGCGQRQGSRHAERQVQALQLQQPSCMHACLHAQLP